MYIEDLILNLAKLVQMNPFDGKVVRSFETQIFIGTGLTTKQADLAVKILKRQKSKLENALGASIDTFLDNPLFRLKKRDYNYSKFYEICDHDRFQKAIKVNFPYNEAILQKIRQKKSEINLAYWDPEKKNWYFPLDEKSLNFLKDLASEFEFQFSEDISVYFEEIGLIKKTMENFVPMVTFKEKTVKFQNFSEFTPVIETNDILEALFFARKVGVSTWDDEVDKFLLENFKEQPVQQFLNSDPSQYFEFSLENSSIFDLKPIISNLLPCIFVIPGGSELDKTHRGLELLTSMGIDNSEISIMFRLPKETGDNFNKFVRDAKLNNPISDKTKAIFISSKVPKPVIESKIKFKSVVNFNFYNVHYTIREFVKHHQNVITIYDKSPHGRVNFASL